MDQNTDCKLLSTEYVGSRERLRFECSCGNQYSVRWHNFKQGKQFTCPDCSYKHIAVSKTLGIEKCLLWMRKTGAPCKLVSTTYVNCRQPLWFQCSCGNKYSCSWRHFTGSRQFKCSACSKQISIEKRTKQHDQFTSEVRQLVMDEYSVLTKYKGSLEKVEIVHNNCGHHYYVRPSDFLGGNRCPFCSNTARRKLHVAFVEEVFNLVGDEYAILSEYTGNRDNVQLRHTICGQSWWVAPNSFLRGSRCPHCSASKGEMAIQQHLTSSSSIFTAQYSFSDCLSTAGNRLRFDFAIFSDSSKQTPVLLIEFDGKQHFEPVEYFGGQDQFERQKQNDSIKDEYCQQYSIPLLRIPYWDIDRIPEILNAQLQSVGLLDGVA